jgi:RNA polymerase sigma-70 factor (ECF subfamily)
METKLMGLGELSDQKLMALLQDGNQAALEYLVERYKSKLYNTIYRLLFDRETAEDILQETFLRVYRERKSYNPVYCFSTWVYTIALNLTKNEFKRRSRWRFFGLKPNENHSGPSGIANGHLQHILDKAVNKLPNRYKLAFVMRDISQLSYQEIAQSLHIPLGTVKSRVNRARLMLQEQLKPKLESYDNLWKS